jgi:hypothetical protein
MSLGKPMSTTTTILENLAIRDRWALVNHTSDKRRVARSTCEEYPRALGGRGEKRGSGEKEEGGSSRWREERGKGPLTLAPRVQ